MTEIANASNIKRIVYLYSPSTLADLLGFREGVSAASSIARTDDMDGVLRHYVIVMLERLRRTHPSEWNASWMHDAYLGFCYFMVCDHEQTYIAYTRALAKTSPPPPQLLLAIAWCCSCPGEPPIRYEEAIVIVKGMMHDRFYLEGINALISFYKSLRNESEQAFWESKQKELMGGLPPLPPIWELPAIVKEWVPSPHLLT